MELFTNMDTAPTAERKELNLLSLALLWSSASYLSSYLLSLPQHSLHPSAQCGPLHHLPQNYLQHSINAIYLRFAESRINLTILSDNLHCTL